MPEFSKFKNMSQINAIVSKRLQIYRDFVNNVKKMPEFSSAQSAFNAATMMSVTWAIIVLLVAIMTL